MSNDLSEIYLYPEKMLPYIKERWHKVAFGEEKRKGIPSDGHILQLLNTIFQASLSSQERQSIRVRIALCNPDELISDVEVRRRNRPIKFSDPRPFSVSEIVQLAPAVDPRQLIIGVRPTKARGKSGSSRIFEIWGLVDAGHSWWEFVRGESKGSLGGSPPPDCLTVSTMSPGSLVVSRGGRPIVSLEKGNLSLPMTEVFTSGPIGESLNHIYSEFHYDVCKSLGEDKYDPEGYDEDYPQRFLREFLERVLLRVRNRRHGGTILIIPDDWEISDGRLQDRVDIKYPSVDNDIWSILVKYLSLHRRYYDKLLPACDYNTVSKELFSEIQSLEMEYEDTEDLVRDRANLIASFTNVDGSVVITTKLGLRGFGAEIVAPSPALRQIKVAADVSGKSGNMRPITDYGTRHRSACRFCSSHEGLMAFLISQDGDIRVIKRVGSDVILWSGIVRRYF